MSSVRTLLVVCLVALGGGVRSEAAMCPAPAGCVLSGAEAAQLDALCLATGFADFGATGEIFATQPDGGPKGFIPLDDPGGRYDEGDVNGVIQWARGASPTCGVNGILLEASFRKASAHGQFGDENLLRGLHAAFTTPSLLANAIDEGLLRLDSRQCHAASGPTLVATGQLCNTVADCESGEVCEAVRVSTTAAVYGAVQEYRRAEAALITAMRVLGPAQFQGVDGAQGGCPGGCASRLLVRLGAMKARAQAERVDRLWRRAVAAVGAASVTAECAAGLVGETCTVDEDCDDGLVDVPKCGETAVERAFVVLRQAAHEALAEAAVMQAFYEQFVSAEAAQDNPDITTLQGALADIALAAERAAASETPFGLPADFVPLLTSVQREQLNCRSGCNPATGGNPCPPAAADQNKCLINLAVGDEVANILQGAEEDQEAASFDAQQFVDQLQNTDAHADDIREEFFRDVVRLFGAPCTDDPGCTCSAADAEAGRCFTIAEPDLQETWVVAGVECDDPDNPFATCTADQADGEVERQLHLIREAQAALADVASKIDRNRATFAKTADVFARLVGIEAETCDLKEAAITDAGNQIGAVMADSISFHEKIEQQGDVIKFIARGSYATAVKEVAKELGAVGEVVVGVIDAFDCFVGGCDSGKHEAQVALGIARAQVQKEQELTRIECLKSLQTIAVEQDRALWDVETRGQELLHEARLRRGQVIDALIALNQLITEARRARERFDQSRHLQAVWQNQNFRNPQNYRAMALQAQLRAAQKFRLAQFVTWLILRASAYDLAQPDFLEPQLLASDARTGTISPARLARVRTIGSCQQHYVCSNDEARSCLVDADCGGGSCDPASESTVADVADSTGKCSLRAVFSAQTVDDLRDLIRSAYLTNLGADRTIHCNPCRKVVQLQRIMTAYETPPVPGGFPPLGSFLRTAPLAPGPKALVDFEITLKRDFQVCRPLPDASSRCHPVGVAGLGNDGSGPGANASGNISNARALRVLGLVRYQAGLDPRVVRCRDTVTGGLVGGGSGCLGKPEGALCTAQGLEGRCNKLFTGEPAVELVQLGRGVIRTNLADFDVPGGMDSLLSFQLRRGSLPLNQMTSACSAQASTDPSAWNPCAIPRLRPVSVNFNLASSVAAALGNDEIKGLPVASPRWQLRINSGGVVFAGDAAFREFLATIADIELILYYQGFTLSGV